MRLVRFLSCQFQTLLTALFLAFILISGTASANAYPERALNLIVPFPPGGAVDQAGRAISDALSTVWSEPVVVQTKAGAGGGLGMASVAQAQPDGYTLLAAHPSLLTIPEADKLYDRTSRFSLSSFTPLALLVADPTILVVKADAPWQTYEELVNDAKQRPDSITYSSSGAYGALHIPIEMLSEESGIKLRHIPYQGGGPALLAVLSGQVDVTAGVPAVVAPRIKSGELRALISTGAKRHPLLPSVPTAIEKNHENVEFYLWVGLFAPKDTDDAVADAIRAGIGQAVKHPKFITVMENIGSPVDYRDGDDFKAFLQSDYSRIESAIQRIGKVD